MGVIDGIELGLSYIQRGLGVVIPLALLITISYQVFYKYALKGKKELNYQYFLLGIMSLCYAIVVICAVFLDRGTNARVVVLHPFSTYGEAWGLASLQQWKNIILNFILFIPLGVIMPLWGRKWKRGYKVFFFALFTTLLIEVSQFISMTGVSDIDDVIGNVWGAMIGYGIVRMFQERQLPLKRYIKKSIVWLSPLFLAIIMFCSLYSIYQTKDFGNMASFYMYNAHMNNRSITFNDMDELPNQANVYRKVVNENINEDLVEAIFAEYGLTIEERIVHDNEVTYRSYDHILTIWIDYNNYYLDLTYTNDVEESDGNAKIIIEALSDLGFILDEHYRVGYIESSYHTAAQVYFNHDFLEDHTVLGELTCILNKDGLFNDIVYRLNNCESITTFDLKSLEQVKNDLKAGHFNQTYLENEENHIHVLDIELDYLRDSKGFYQPIYIVTTENGFIVVDAKV